MRKLKILLAYEHYPCSIAKFWKRGLQKLGHTVETIGNSTGGKISWGPYDLSRHVDVPTYPLPDFSNRYPIDLWLYNKSKEYEIFLNVDAAHWWIGKLPIPKVIIGTDPHCVNYDQQRQDSDLFVCMQNYYSKPGDYWIPYAHDEDYHFHMNVPITHDVTFHGVVYNNRRSDLDALESSGIRTDVRTGVVFDECVPYYCSGPVAYCRPSLLDLPARFFEALAYGTIPVLTPVPDLKLFPQFVDGEHYETFVSQEELIEKVRGVLALPAEEIIRRKQACLDVSVGNSWVDRARDLLSVCEEAKLL